MSSHLHSQWTTKIITKLNQKQSLLLVKLHKNLEDNSIEIETLSSLYKKNSWYWTGSDIGT